uniref:Uncharacterized protein n=1 Tax=Kalanchoe fedtschenkoi TaxID=63787 RepID=A0A7N0SVZ7_KALFE
MNVVIYCLLRLIHVLTYKYNLRIKFFFSLSLWQIYPLLNETVWRHLCLIYYTSFDSLQAAPLQVQTLAT